MKIIQMFQNTMLKHPLTRDRFLCALCKAHTGLVSLVVGPVYSMYSLCTLKISSLGGPAYTSKLNTIVRRKFLIEFVLFGSQTYQLEFDLAGLISDLPHGIYNPRCYRSSTIKQCTYSILVYQTNH